MSLTATRFSRAYSSSEYSAILSLEEALFEEGYEWDGRELIELNPQSPIRPATEGDLSYLRQLFWHEGVRGQDLKQAIASLGLTKGGEKILHEAVRDYRQKPLNEYVAKYHLSCKLYIWQQQDAANGYAITQPLLNCRFWHAGQEFKAEADWLWVNGIRWIEDAIKVYELLPHVWTKGRSWESPYQINANQLVLVATNANYKNLPLWAKVQIIKGNHASSRPGDVWRTLMPALKAWKWDNTIPKRFAKRLGEMSPKYRALGAIAWQLSDAKSEDFWVKFQELCLHPMKAINLLLWGKAEGYPVLPIYQRNRALENLWGLPHKYLDTNEDMIQESYHYDDYHKYDLITKYGGGSSAVCRTLFGCGGKQVQKLFKTSTSDQRKWAIALAYAKEDLIQKYLGTECVPYQEEAVEFLKSLGEKPALRMIQTTKMVIRGKENDVTADYVRDTGYLFKQLVAANVTPDLGRVRCWFSTHEVLAKEYVKILPDFELKVSPDFAPLDGLSSLDMAWELEIPKHQHQLKRYGEILSHCVGGYGAAVNQGSSVIVAVYHNGILKYTLEFTQGDRRYHCNQFYGFRNSYPSESDRAIVLDMFHQARLID